MRRALNLRIARASSAVLLAACIGVACERPTEPGLETIVLESDWTAPIALLTPFDTVELRPRVRAVDQEGRPVQGARVIFASLRQPDAHFVREVPTNASGYAELDTLWVLGRTSGTQTMLAYLVSGQTGDPLEFDVTVSPGPATRITISHAAGFNIPVGDTVQFIGTYRDIHGNPIPSGPAIAFSSSAPSLLAVNPTGEGVALAAGNVWVRAQGGGRLDSIQVVVGPRVLVVTNRFAAISGVATPDGAIFGSNWDFSAYRFDIARATFRAVNYIIGYNDFAYSSQEQVVWHVGEGLGGLRALHPITGALVRTVASPSGYLRLALSPDGSEAFVTPLGGSLRRINTATGAAVSSVPLGADLNGIALDPARGTVFVSRTQDAKVYRISMSTLAVLDSTTDGVGSTQGIALSSDGTKLYVVRSAGVSVHDPVTMDLIGSLAGVTGAYDVAVSEKGRAVIITRINPGRVWVFDANTDALRFEAELSLPRRILIDPLTQDAFVLSQSGNVYRVLPR